MQTKNIERERFLDAVKYPTIFLVLLWVIRGIEVFFKIDLSPYSLYPKHFSGLVGIITAPLLHADLGHIAANSIPVWVLGTGVFYFYKEIAWKVMLITYTMTGFWTWIIGRSVDEYGFAVHHLGASGLIYAWAFFLFFSGVFRRSVQLSAISFLIIFLYGSIVWGLLPLEKAVSFESHICGALSGLVCAFYYRKEGPQRKRYKWEDEEEDDENDNSDAYWMPHNQHLQAPPHPAEEPPKEEPEHPFKLNYYYKKDGNEEEIN